MEDKITTIFGLMAAIGTAGTTAAITFGYAGLVGVFGMMAAIGTAGLGYFSNKKGDAK